MVTVETGGRAPAPTARLGADHVELRAVRPTELDTLMERLPPLPAAPRRLAARRLAELADTALAGQGLFDATGAVHAAVAFTTDGEVVVLPGRTSAGTTRSTRWSGALLLDGRLPGHELGLAVTGRASFEIVQKAWSAGFPTVVAVSAPTALAVAAARRAGMTLAGFARAGRLNLYAPERPLS